MTDAITHLEKTIAGEVQPVTHLEKAIAGEVEPVTHLEKVIAEYSGGGGSATLIEKNITANGEYSASADEADGYSKVTVDVPNSYTAQDEGKVVNSGELVAQTSTTATVNGTINTTTNNEVVVNVPNTYTAGDEGKVVSNGALVAQTAYPSTITQNNTYDTTNYNSVTVEVSSTSTSASAQLYKDAQYSETEQICLSICNGIVIVSGTFNLSGSTQIFYIKPQDLLLSDFFDVNKTITGNGVRKGSTTAFSLTCNIDVTSNSLSIRGNTNGNNVYFYCDTQ